MPLDRRDFERLITEGSSAVGVSATFVDDLVRQSKPLDARLAPRRPT
jgi:hypothetical protein